uniref:16S rRNA (uracil(1498)-N(3))-methyltransferase n=1 Tax=Phaeodactylum tricornutum TaxID=2850 RepID=A0A8J9X396_PHATR
MCSRRLAMPLLLLVSMQLPRASRAWVGTLRPQGYRKFSVHLSTVCRLNRFLFDTSEVKYTDTELPSITLPRDDFRTIHASKILGLRNGNTIRAGLVSCEVHQGLLTDDATVQWIPEGKVKKAEPLGNGNPPGSLHIHLNGLQAPAEQLVPSVSLILALPRPLQLGRMLPMISQMGVNHLVLAQAQKVPKDYFGSHLLRNPEELREKLIEGLCQAGDVRLPQLHIVRNLRDFLTNEVDEIFPKNQYARAIAHPQRTSDPMGSLKKMKQVEFPVKSSRLVVAVGPEGGWEEPDELDRFRDCGFQQITMGARVLRSDCAVVSLLSLAHDICADQQQ